MPDSTSLDRFTADTSRYASKGLSAWDELALGHIEDAERNIRRAMQHLTAARDLNRHVTDTCHDSVSGLADILSDLSAAKKEIE